MKKIHRINDFALFKFIEREDLMDFNVIQSEINLINKHYIPNFHIEFQDTKNVNNIIWETGNFVHTLNKIYSGSALYIPTVDSIQELKFTDVHILLKQGFRWDNLFGLLVVIKNSKTNEILVSQNLLIGDFTITENKELTEGSFWLEETILSIPTTKDIMSCQIIPITFSDISNTTGEINIYPQNFVLLVDEKPVPDFIKTLLSFDDNHFLKIQTTTDETKTLEKSLLDYFETSSAIIEISHVINYGTELLGYSSLRISNENNRYNSISIGLNLLPYFDEQLLTEQIVNIFVSTEILVNNKLMIREAQINTDIASINPFIIAKVTHPDTNYPVVVTNMTTVNNTIIEAKESTKIVQIYTPVFAEMIVSDIIYQNKDIYFDKIKTPTYLKILSNDKNSEQAIISKSTSDGKFYFGLGDLNPLNSDCIYELINAISMQLIGTGKILIK
jgi:hypothetical protein